MVEISTMAEGQSEADKKDKEQKRKAKEKEFRLKLKEVISSLMIEMGVLRPNEKRYIIAKSELASLVGEKRAGSLEDEIISELMNDPKVSSWIKF